MADPLAPLRARFRARCADDAAAIRAWLADGGDATALETLVHQLAGAAGTLGFAELSAAAMDIDQDFGGGRLPSPGMLEALAERLEATSAEGHS